MNDIGGSVKLGATLAAPQGLSERENQLGNLSGQPSKNFIKFFAREFTDVSEYNLCRLTCT
jgi:hypothetical protein